jgi:hypothetical protein
MFLGRLADRASIAAVQARDVGPLGEGDASGVGDVEEVEFACSLLPQQSILMQGKTENAPFVTRSWMVARASIATVALTERSTSAVVALG